jgi:5-(carboxyamino)imidazole ribonucleotide synthase
MRHLTISSRRDRAVLERWVEFRCEISVVGARDVKGGWVGFPAGENVHCNGILDYTLAPAPSISAVVAMRANGVAHQVAHALGHVGTIGVEMFVMPDDSLVVNEIAPRPHNSGHHTIDAGTTSQFGLQLHTVLGERVSDVDATQHTPAVMVNLLGDVWANGEPNWSVLDGQPRARLHLYGKRDARAGRKMGHLTVLSATGQDIHATLAEALALRDTLAGPSG